MSVFVILVFLCCCASTSFAQIEILAGGQRYESVDSYKALRELKQAQVKEHENVLIGQPSIVEAQPLTPAKVMKSAARTIVLAELPDRATLRKLRWMNVHPAAQGDLLVNPQAWHNPRPILVRLIKSQHLEEAIEKAMKQSSGAKMIVSKDNTVKILSLSPGIANHEAQ